MFTSRAEFRLLLREDNADQRLTPIAREFGLIDDSRWAAFCAKQEEVARCGEDLEKTWIVPGTEKCNAFEQDLNLGLTREYNLASILKRPEIKYHDIAPYIEQPTEHDQVIEQLEINAKYAGYMSRQQEEIARLQKNEGTKLPLDMDYATVVGLSNEVVQKLNEHRPVTVGQAGRIQGITPASLSLLLIHMKKVAS